MPFPPILFALLEGGTQVKIVGAQLRTRRNIIVYDKEVFRDVPPPVAAAAIVGPLSGGLGPVDEASISGGVQVVDATTETGWSGGYMMKSDSSILQDDNYTHNKKRHVAKIDTLVEFWDDEDGGGPGMAMEMEVTTVLGNATITVPDSHLLVPGQSIVAEGSIPAGTKILSTITENDGTITRTTAIMSKKATAAGSVVATLGGSNLVGEFMQSEFIDWGDENSLPT